MEKKVKKKSSTISYVVLGAIVAGILGIGYKVYKEPRFVKVAQNTKSAEIEALENKIAELEKLVENIQHQDVQLSLQDVAALNEKVDRNQKLNLEMLETKASLPLISGVLERLDRIESNMSGEKQISSQSALILTAAGLTESVAKTGKSFVYEASVLQELCNGTRMEKSADIIASYALKGLPNKENLIQKFNALYEEAVIKEKDIPSLEPQQSKIRQTGGWKDKIMDKLSKLIVIKKIQQDNSKILQNVFYDDAYELVQKGDFEGAALKMNTDSKYQTENFEIWLEDVRAEGNFDEQMSKIKALTLGQMKAENVMKALREGNE